MVWDRQLYLRHQDDQAMRDSLQRYVSRTTIEGQFRNILHGRAALTEFHFTYKRNINRCILILMFILSRYRRAISTC
ncbi:hypothetical protein CWS02_11915 [Enterobacter sp. EA-1]|nr:hypothetical protein CWS02_11915 [Enterobacter sp. EA-1]